MNPRPVLLPLWALWFGLLAALYLTVPTSPDQALFDYIAWSHLQGDVYYGGAVEQNFPGKMLLHEIGIRLFGAEFWSFRAVDALLLGLVTLAGAGFLRRCGFTIAPWVFLFLYPPLYVTAGYWLAGQRDIVAMGLLLGAAVLALPPDGRRSFLASLAAGALVAMAALIRPTYLSALAGLLIFDWLRLAGEPRLGWATRLGQNLALILGFLAVIAAIAAYGVRLGVLDDFYQQAILFNLEAYQIPESRWRLLDPIVFYATRIWHWILALALLGGVIWGIRHGAVRGLLLVVGLAVMVILSYFVQNKGFGYHLGGLLPLMILLNGVAVDGLATWAREGGTRLALRRLALLAVATLMVLGTASKLWSYRENIAHLARGEFIPVQHNPGQPSWQDISDSVRLIREGSDPDAFMLQWGRVFVVPFLAERRSTLRFFQIAGLDGFGAGFSGYPDWLAEIAHDLRDKRPAFVLIDTKEVSLPPASLAGTTGVSIDRMVWDMLTDYEVVQRTPHYILMEAR